MRLSGRVVASEGVPVVESLVVGGAADSAGAQSLFLPAPQEGRVSYPLGEKPLGLIMYTDDRYMSAQLT